MPEKPAAAALMGALFTLAASPAFCQSLENVGKTIDSQLMKTQGENNEKFCRHSKDSDWERLTCRAGDQQTVTISEFLGDKSQHWDAVMTVTCSEGEYEARVLPDGTVQKNANGNQSERAPGQMDLNGVLSNTKNTFLMWVLQGDCRKPVEFAYDEDIKNGMPRGILDFPGGNPTPA